MTEHRPKTAALIAYSGDLLSSEGRRRVDAHLAGCAVCREELAAMEMYDSLIEDVRSSRLPALDFESMEVPLAREAENLSRQMVAQKRRRSAAPWVAVAMAAAAGLAIWAWRAQPARPAEASLTDPSVEAPSEIPAPAPEVSSPLAESPRLTPVVTLAAGSVDRLAGAEPIEVGLGDLIPEGSTLRTAENSEVHVRLSNGTAIRLAEGTRTTLDRARTDAVDLELREGTVAARVASLSSGSTFVVACAGYEVHVTGTRFVVSYLEDVVGVDLSEGSVLIRDPNGAEIRLTAPARWRSSGGVDGEPAAPAIRGAEEPHLTPTPVTLSDERIVRWSLDGIDVDALGTVQVGVSPGEHQVRGWDARGRLFRVVLPVGTTPVSLDPGSLRAQAPRVHAGHLDPEDIRRVLGRGMRQVQRCYERSLRQSSHGGGGHARLRLDIGVMGDVQRAQIRGVPDGPLSTCIRNYAMRWTFPPPGGPVSLEQPLNLTPRQ